MRALTPIELQRMRATQDSAMMDCVVLMPYSESKDSLNHPVPSWAPDGPILNCGIDMTGGEEIWQGGKVVVTWQARIRLPLGTKFDLRDCVRVVIRYGQPTDNNTVYGFDGPAQEGPSGIVVPIKKVQPSA